MSLVRTISWKKRAVPTREGAGVHLRRVFGGSDANRTDPFLMLDDFRSERPDEYLAGFPWHPHRGIETVTYMLEGTVEHGDSIGNAGSIPGGNLQWMTAGSGIIHQEMPKPVNGKMGGFQLWVNLPAANKMMKPRYQEITADMVPEIAPEEGVRIKVLAGSCFGATGPVNGIVADPLFLDLIIRADKEFYLPVEPGYTVFIYVIEGDARFSSDEESFGNGDGLLFGDGDEIRIRTRANAVRFLLISGRPIHEPIAWRGPIVMNTQEELDTAIAELEIGTFLRD